MSHSQNSKYLDGKVKTASQPQLHLMLLEGAIRFGQQAKKIVECEPDSAEVERLLTRMLDIVEELALSTAGDKEELSKQFEERYAFVYRELAACRLNRQLEKLDDCLRLLQFEHETWKLACGKLESHVPEKGSSAQPSAHFDYSVGESFSLEA